MRTDDFLESVWPTSGFYCLATPNPQGRGFRHHVFDTVSQAAARARALDAAGVDVYYAVATLANRRIRDPRKDGTGGWRIRTKDNLHHLKALFFEIDVLKPHELESATEEDLRTKYRTTHEALEALRQFCMEVGLPRPTIVSSGYGLHVYFVLEQSVKAKSAEMLQAAVAKLAHNRGFKLDHQAKDISRVFRPVGTHNHKDPTNPRSVEVLVHSGAHDVMELGRIVRAAREKFGVDAPQPSKFSNVPAYLNFGESNLHTGSDPLRLDLLMRCGAIKEVADAKGDVDFPRWYATLQVVRLSEGGRQACHEISMGEAYDAAETDRQLDNLEDKDVGPTTCERFSELSSACAACPWRGKVKSPALLGHPQQRSLDEQAPEAAEYIPKFEEIEVSPDLTVQLPPPPDPYERRGAHGIYVTVTTKDGDEIEQQIFANDLMPLGRKYNERENREYTRWRSGTPADGVVEVEIASSALYDKRSFAGAMADVGVYLDPGYVDDVRNYMVAYIQELQKHIKREELYSRLGWRENYSKFVLGDTLYTADGVETCQIERNNRAASGIRSEGTFEEWRSIVELYNRDEFIPHQLAFGVAFGAPLMGFTGQAGGIINLLGKSGEGKSTVQKLVNSVWGHPVDLMLPAEANSSTQNAKIGYIHLLNNLPVCAEEITNVPANEVQSLAYAINTGEEKMRMDRTGGMKPARGGWNTIMLSSSNSSLHDKLASTQGSAATSLRIMEIRMPLVRVYSKTDFFQRFEIPLQKNFGHAGHRYAQFLAKNHDRVRDIVHRVMAGIDRDANAGNEERVWVAIGAASLAGLALAKTLGLHDFDLDKIRQYLLSQLHAMRAQTKELQTSAAEALAMYLDACQRNTLVVEPVGIAGAGKGVSVVSKPFDGLDVRFELHTGKMFIKSTALRRWCDDNGFIYNDMVSELKRDGIVTQTGRLRTLGAGTEFRSGQVRCLIVNTEAHAFSGGASLSVVQDNSDQPQQKASNDE